MSAVPDFLPALPELVLLVATLLLLMLGAFGGPETKRSMSWLTVLAMGVALVAVLATPGETRTTFEGLFVVDAFGRFMKALVLLDRKSVV